MKAKKIKLKLDRPKKARTTWDFSPKTRVKEESKRKKLEDLRRREMRDL